MSRPQRGLLFYVPNMVRCWGYNEITKINADYFRHRRIYMRTKQIISIALMLAMLVTVITGCSTKEGSSTNSTEESAAFFCFSRNERKRRSQINK